jgi:ribosomal protection tetracycline resistance protein
MTRVTLEFPAATMSGVLSVLAQLGAAVETPFVRGELSVLKTALPSAQAHSLQQQLPRLTGGEGVIEASFGGYRPVRGTIPARPRTGNNPLDRKEYIRQVL